MGKEPLLFTDRRQFLVALGDFLILCLSLLAALRVSQALGQETLRWRGPAVLLLGSCLSVSALALQMRRRDPGNRRGLVLFSPGLFIAFLTALALVAGLVLWFRASPPLFTPLVLFLGSSATLSLGWHRLAEAASLGKKKRLLFIGKDSLVAEHVEITQERHRCGYEIAGYWPNHKLLELSDDLLKKIPHLNIHHLIYSERWASSPQSVENLRKIRFKKITLSEASLYYQKLTGSVPVFHMDGQQLLGANPQAFRQPRFAAMLKRAVDIFLTSLLLPPSLPLLLISALAIKLDSRGPVFFIQERLGQNGKPFKMLKLRTMIVDAEQHAPQWCQDNDPRVTRVGKILRKLRLDELPQLLNVLRNDMSLVGPRPIRQHFTDLLAQEIPFYRLRLLAKPGLTGWAQVHAGHANTVAGHAKMLQYDLFYLLHRSLWLDLTILLKTVGTVALGKGR